LNKGETPAFVGVSICCRKTPRLRTEGNQHFMEILWSRVWVKSHRRKEVL